MSLRLYRKRTELLALIVVISGSVKADGKTNVWKQEQLNKPYMVALTKDQCMRMTIKTLREVCTDDACRRTTGGVLGDCVTWASGSR